MSDEQREWPEFDLPRIERAVREILIALGEDPDREGLQRTPARVASSYAELCAGLREEPRRHLDVTFDEEHRELVILRTAARTRSEYEWGMHVALFREPCRLTDAELVSLQYGAPADPVWSETEALVLLVVDELHETSTLSEATWTRVQAAFDPTAIVELVVTVGNYHLLAFFLNACRIPLEEGAAHFK